MLPVLWNTLWIEVADCRSLLCISKYIFLFINIVWPLPYADDSVDKGDDNRVPE